MQLVKMETKEKENRLAPFEQGQYESIVNQGFFPRSMNIVLIFQRILQQGKTKIYTGTRE